jgi:primosomal protein N' (replication factor Y) (superfamily II helicase)
MIAEIIPITKLIRNLSTFSYLIPKEIESLLQVGQITDINFHGRNIQAIVIDIKKEKPKYKLKKIKNIVFPFPLLTKDQIELISQTAEYYASSPATIAKTVVPKIPKKQKKYLVPFESGDKKDNKIKPNKKTKPEFLWYPSETEKINFYQKKIDSTKSGQVLFLIPEIDQIDQIISKLNLKGKDYLKLDSKTANGQLFELWCDLLNKKDKIVFGTKMAVFLPWTNLKQIIVDESQNWNHKNSEQNPRYDARKIADLICERNKAKISLISPSPTVESFLKNNLKNTKQKSKNLPQLEIVNLKDEETKGNYTFLSDDFWHLAKAYILQKKQVIVVHNRKGLAGYVHCPECGFVFGCPDCETSLVYYQKTSRLHCHQCDFSRDVPPLCPKCSGSQIKFSSKGTEDIIEKIKSGLPAYKVIGADKQNISKIKDFDEYQIVVGTQFVLNKVDWSKVGLLFFSNVDQFLVSPDFRSPEKIFQILSSATTKLDSKSHFLIQTYQPQNIFLKALKSSEPDAFYEQELKNRKKLSYPPFVQIVKIFFRDKSQSKAYYLSDKLAKDLKNQKLTAEIKGPIPAYPRKVRDQFFYNIILKIKPEDFEKTIKKIKDIVPADFVIDVDPERII